MGGERGWLCLGPWAGGAPRRKSESVPPPPGSLSSPSREVAGAFLVPLCSWLPALVDTRFHKCFSQLRGLECGLVSVGPPPLLRDSHPVPVGQQTQAAAPCPDLTESAPAGMRWAGPLGVSDCLSFSKPWLVWFPTEIRLHTAARQECGPAQGPWACLCN